MAERYDVTLDELERTVRVAGAAQVEVQAEARPPHVGLFTGACSGGAGPDDGDAD